MGKDRDPFEGTVFDERFVRAARTREPSASERAARTGAQRSRIGPAGGATGPPKRTTRRRRAGWHPFVWLASPKVRTAAVLVVLACGYAAQYQGWIGSSGPQWLSGQPVVGAIDTSNRPTPAPAVSPEPLGVPVPMPAGGGPHGFLVTQPDSAEPVAYDPCRPIPYVVNSRTAPPGAHELITDAVRTISQITGLRFDDEGPTDEPMTSPRPAFQPERYGDRWAPVLISWSDPQETPDLDGYAGIGGSTAVYAEPGTLAYVSGIVALDGPGFAEMLTWDNGYTAAKAVVLHELGHLLGLAHVDDAGQLMHDEGHPGIHDFQHGDLTGLARLARGACFAEL